MFKFLIVDNASGTVWGTDDQEIAFSYVGPDDYYVIDTDAGGEQVMLVLDGEKDVSELSITEVKTHLGQEEEIESVGEDADPGETI